VARWPLKLAGCHKFCSFFFWRLPLGKTFPEVTLFQLLLYISFVWDQKFRNFPSFNKSLVWEKISRSSPLLNISFVHLNEWERPISYPNFRVPYPDFKVPYPDKIRAWYWWIFFVSYCNTAISKPMNYLDIPFWS